jgi:kumamolisin
MANSALIGSERHIMAGATRLGRAAAGERLEVSVILRPVGDTVAGRVARIAQGEAVAPLSRADFAAQCAAAPADMQAVEAFATAHHLTVVEAAPARRTIILSGTVARFEAAFGVELDAYEHESGTFRGRTGPVMLPPALHGVVQAVLGLDNRPAARAQFRRRHGETPATGHAPAQRAGAAPVSYTPLDLAGLYRFPAGTGAGEAIGIIELGGGTRAADARFGLGRSGEKRRHRQRRRAGWRGHARCRGRRRHRAGCHAGGVFRAQYRCRVSRRRDHRHS